MKRLIFLAGMLLGAAGCHQPAIRATAPAQANTATQETAPAQANTATQETAPAEASTPAQGSTPVQASAPSQDGRAPAAVAAFLKLHNQARAEVGVPPLQWSDKLAAYAQDWADQVARSGRFEHRADNPYGENLAGFSPPDGPEAGVRLWLAEKERYKGERMDGRNFAVFGHYTQMIWRKTLRVGYGIAQMPDGMWVLVANYEPGGNMDGEHPYR